jgi:hypothetical protein
MQGDSRLPGERLEREMPLAVRGDAPGRQGPPPTRRAALEVGGRVSGMITRMSSDVCVVIADQRLTIDQALAKFRSYRIRTVDTYDLKGVGDPNIITLEEATRTRAVSSRLSNKEAAWIVARSQTAPWPSPEADLADADPSEQDGLYDQMNSCYEHFASDRPRNVDIGKISKVLHIKRPKLFPILDTEVRACYRQAARRAAKNYPERGYKKMFWAAIRDDLIANRKRGSLAELRGAFASEPPLRVYPELTDLRLLDILTWR